MKKLTLDLANLRVDAFETTAIPATRGGTVHGQSNTTHYPPQCTAYPNTCDLLCFGSWHDTDCC
jgi:hypothetical protein